MNVIIEVPIGGEPIKYEMDKAAGTLVVDRFLHTPMRYPGNYGFVPHTLSEDGDPIDVLVANTRPIIPGAVINVRPIGVLKMEDDGGGDEKIIAVPTPRLTKRYAACHELHRSAGDHVASRSNISFAHYKDLEPGKWVKLIGGVARRGAPAHPRSDRTRPRAGQGLERNNFSSTCHPTPPYRLSMIFFPKSVPTPARVRGGLF